MSVQCLSAHSVCVAAQGCSLLWNILPSPRRVSLSLSILSFRPSWRQQHRFNQLCLEVSTPIQKVLPEDTTKAANDVANNGASAAGDARPPNPSPNATTSHGEPPIPVLCDLTAKRVSQIVRRAQTIEEKLLQLEKKRWARTVDDVRKSLKATHELMQAGNSTEHPPEPADNTDTNASASMAST